MELNKKNVRIILLIIVFTVVLFTAVQNIGAILGFAVNVWGVFSSVIAGLAIAFVLNVPLPFARRLLMARKLKHSNKRLLLLIQCLRLKISQTSR